SYNIFGSVSRDTGEMDPHFYLETTVLNLEKIEGAEPRAFLRMEFALRDSTSERIVLSHRNERYSPLYEDSVVYLVQIFNNMIMEETNTFAAKCIMHFTGIPMRSGDINASLSAPEQYYYEQMSDVESHKVYGELLLKTKINTTNEMQYRLEKVDSLNTRIYEEVGEMNKPLLLTPGRYKITIGHNADIFISLNIYPRQRTVVVPTWSELMVQVFDESQTRVRQMYDLWMKTDDEYGYQKVGSDFSVSDEEHGIEDKLWILPHGSYLLTVGGANWSDLRDFATIVLGEGDAKIMTVVVDPTRSGSILVGAGVLGDGLGLGTKRIHRGAIHGNVNFSSNNQVAEKDPTFSFTLAGQFDNTIETDLRPFHYTLRSIYDLGASVSTGTDFRISLDQYSLKNVLLFYPWGRETKFLNNLAVYGRGDLTTHFWDGYTFFSDNKNIIMTSSEGDTLLMATDQDRLRTRIACFPLRGKEGTGLTYRIALSPNSWLSLRGGYGWQQDINHRSFTLSHTGTHEGINYDFYQESEDDYAKGLESTLILSAVNMLNFISLNSTVDVLFPMEDAEIKPRLENENRLNIRIYRNISLDLRVNLKYDESVNPWLVYDYSTFLRMSLFY
ncbi:MAG TPA: hypothetical protein PKI59_03410, partial [Candidatus Cloacimonadota bacterium]|nr:hypothetical protein [Candidatus Cloacimonadota bacterium]